MKPMHTGQSSIRIIIQADWANLSAIWSNIYLLSLWYYNSSFIIPNYHTSLSFPINNINNDQNYNKSNTADHSSYNFSSRTILWCCCCAVIWIRWSVLWVVEYSVGVGLETVDVGGWVGENDDPCWIGFWRKINWCTNSYIWTA